MAKTPDFLETALRRRSGGKLDPQNPKIAGFGNIPADAFDHMNAQQIAGWFKDRFQDPYAHQGASWIDLGGTIDWVGRAFENSFSDVLKGRLAAGMAVLLDEIAENPQQWPAKRDEKQEHRGSPLFDMAFFVTVFNPENCPQESCTPLQQRLAAMLDNPSFTPEQKDCLLLAIVHTGYQAPMEKWDHWVKKGGKDAFVYAFQGMCQSNLSDTFDWMAKQSWDESKNRLIDMAMPWLIKKYGADDVIVQLKKLPNYRAERDWSKEIKEKAAGSSAGTGISS